jgi:hypothetical protein
MMRFKTKFLRLQRSVDQKKLRSTGLEDHSQITSPIVKMDFLSPSCLVTYLTNKILFDWSVANSLTPLKVWRNFRTIPLACIEKKREITPHLDLMSFNLFYFMRTYFFFLPLLSKFNWCCLSLFFQPFFIYIVHCKPHHNTSLCCV